MTTKPMSRQRRWQLAKVAIGCCEKCGHKRGNSRSSRLCSKCHKRDLERKKNPAVRAAIKFALDSCP